MDRRLLARWPLAATLASGAILLLASTSSAQPQWTVNWDWRMPERTHGVTDGQVSSEGDWKYRKPEHLLATGFDTNGDDLNDCFLTGGTCDDGLAAVEESIKPPEGWKVEFFITLDDGEPGDRAYSWEIPGGIPVTFSAETRSGYAYFPKEGRYRVKLTVSSGRLSTSSTREIVVQDWLIVAMGDSYISGEGNPDHPGDIFALRPPTWEDRRCHRSTNSWPALAAQWIEDLDDKSSVTLIHLGCGGSLVSEGLYGFYEGSEATDPHIPPQLDQVRELAGDRGIDAVLISSGGNDVGFAKIVEKCMLQGDCNLDEATFLLGREVVCGSMAGLRLYDACMAHLPAVEQSPSAKVFFQGLFAGDPATHVPGLALKYEYLRPMVQAMNLVEPQGVYMLEYPRGTRDETGAMCGSETRLFDMLPGIVTSEASWAESDVQGVLNATIANYAATNGWTALSLTTAFNNHGYCANPASPTTAGDGAWFVRLDQSLITESAIIGTLHPNLRGHYEIARNLESKLAADFWNDGVPARGVKRLPDQPGVVIDIDAAYSLDEGSSLTLRNGSYYYDGAEPTFQWDVLGGCTAAVSLDDRFVRSPVLTATDNCVGELGITVGTEKTFMSVPLRVRNVVPKVVIGTLRKGSEGSATTLVFSFKDPGALDTHEITIDWGDGGPEEGFKGDAMAGQDLTQEHTYRDNGDYTIGVSVLDKDGGLDKDRVVTQVANVAPRVSEILGIPTPVPINTLISPTVSFTDPGRDDTHTASWTWGDGAATNGTVTETAGAGTAAGSHAYANAGIYAVQASITDKDGATTASTPQSAIVFSPDAGSVTGGGTAGGTPRSAFAFVVNYRSNTLIPGGRLQYEQPASFRLLADSFQWLAVNGPNAWFAGTGSVNGVAGHAFLVSVADGARLTPAGTDRFRIKIWNPAGQVLFDSEPASPDLAAAAGVVATGNVLIR